MNQMRHDTTGDTSVSEGRRVGSGRSRRGCFGGRRMGQNPTDPDSKRGRSVESERATFSDFLTSEMKVVGEEGNRLRGSIVSLIAVYCVEDVL